MSVAWNLVFMIRRLAPFVLVLALPDCHQVARSDQRDLCGEPSLCDDYCAAHEALYAEVPTSEPPLPRSFCIHQCMALIRRERTSWSQPTPEEVETTLAALSEVKCVAAKYHAQPSQLVAQWLAECRKGRQPVELEARSPVICASWAACRDEGLCSTTRRGKCVAASDADCQCSWACQQGRCVARGGRCVEGAPERDPNCAASCRLWGHCTPSGGRCVATRDTDCRNSVMCATDGSLGLPARLTHGTR